MKTIMIAGLAFAGTLLSVGAAHAGGQVHWSVAVNLPHVDTVISSLPMPPTPRVVVHAPPPVVIERAPRHVVHEPRVIVVQRPVPVVQGPYWYHEPPRHDRRGKHRRHWDRDGDGIPNRYDPVDNRVHGPWGDRDRDGIPNRYDRHDDRHVAQHPQHPRGDRDRDGVPNWRDPRDNRKWRH